MFLKSADGMCSPVTRFLVWILEGERSHGADMDYPLAEVSFPRNLGQAQRPLLRRPNFPGDEVLKHTIA